MCNITKALGLYNFLSNILVGATKCAQQPLFIVTQPAGVGVSLGIILRIFQVLASVGGLFIYSFIYFAVASDKNVKLNFLSFFYIGNISHNFL